MILDINYAFIWLGTFFIGLSLFNMLKLRRALHPMPIARAWGPASAINFLILVSFAYFSLDRPRLQDATADNLLAVLFYIGSLCVFLLVKISVWTTRDLMRVAELEQDVLSDPLTGLFNRRFLDLQLKEACRNSASIAVCAIDIDHFKSINDTYGHPTGDHVIRTIGERLSGCIRKSDIVARIGGEEYVVLLRDLGLSEARHMAERLRQSIESAPVVSDDGQEIDVTISIGVDIRRESDTPVQLLRRTDQALYAAKNAGRNCVAQTPLCTAA